MARSSVLSAVALLGCATTVLAQVPLPAMVNALQSEISKIAAAYPPNTLCGPNPGQMDPCLLRTVSADGNMRSGRHDPNSIQQLANSWGLPSNVASRLGMIVLSESVTFQTFSVTIDAPGGYGEVVEYIGTARRYRGFAEVAVVHVRAVAQLKQQYDQVTTRHCSRCYLVATCCKNHVNTVLRGYNQDEINRIQTGMRAAAYQKLQSVAVITPFKLNHFYTIAPQNEGLSGYRSEGVACYVWPSAPANPGPTGYANFYRYVRTWGNNQVDHFYTTSKPEGDNAVASIGYRAEGVACVLAVSSPPAGALALHRLLQPIAGDHFYTASEAESTLAVRDHGYDYEGIAGYCMPNPGPGLVPLHRYVTV